MTSMRSSSGQLLTGNLRKTPASTLPHPTALLLVRRFSSAKVLTSIFAILRTARHYTRPASTVTAALRRCCWSQVQMSRWSTPKDAMPCNCSFPRPACHSLSMPHLCQGMEKPILQARGPPLQTRVLPARRQEVLQLPRVNRQGAIKYQGCRRLRLPGEDLNGSTTRTGSLTLNWWPWTEHACEHTE